jgi:hypothetical protein
LIDIDVDVREETVPIEAIETSLGPRRQRLRAALYRSGA